MTGWSTKDADEELATQVIQLALHVPVIQHDDRAGTSEYDLKILYSGAAPQCHVDERVGVSGGVREISYGE